MNNERSIEFKVLFITLFLMLILSIYILFVKTNGVKRYQKEISQEYALHTEYIKIDYKYESNKKYIDYIPNSIGKYDEHFIIDNDGVILKKVDNSEEKDLEVYDVETISHYGLLLFSEYIESGNNQYYKLAKTQADYVLSTLNERNGQFLNKYLITLYKSKNINKEYDLGTSWYSGSSQALAISLLSRIYSIEKDEKYKNACLLALKPIKEEMSNGGLKTDLFGYTFYDEYSLQKPVYSLKSIMYIAIALYDFNHNIELGVTDDMFNDCMKTLEFVLSFYNDRGVSLKNLASINNEFLSSEYDYEEHIMHLYQLDVINQINKNDIFEYHLSLWTPKEDE